MLTKQEFEVVGANGTKSYPALGGIYTSGDVIFPKVSVRHTAV